MGGIQDEEDLLFCASLVHSFSINCISSRRKKYKSWIHQGRDLWTFINSEEKQITDTGEVFAKPQWSHDGRWLLYQRKAPPQSNEQEQQLEIWAYQILKTRI